MKLLKRGLTIRGDSLYCPLALSLDSYGNCEADCHHCYFRRLNYVWGQDLKPLDIEVFQKTVTNGISNKNPRSALAWALKKKKTVRFGNKADPFQNAELEHHASEQVMKILIQHGWSFMIQTMFTENMMLHEDLIVDNKDLIVVCPIISPGAESDWEILERKRTTPIPQRIEHLVRLNRKGVETGVNGEPFIPGYHTVDQFEDIVKRLKASGIKSYNTYSFHFNDFVAKRLHNIGIDIEKIWFHNQDKQWKIILTQLLAIAKKHDLILGCPDFVNSGSHQERTNTCCGVNVPNPTTFNIINWKRGILAGKPPEDVFEESWDGVGDKEEGREVFLGKSKDMYTLKDCDCFEGNLFPSKKEGLGFD